MENNKQILKWAARILGGMAIVLFLSFIFGEGISGLKGSGNGQLRNIVLLLAFASLGYIFALFREKEGGIVMIAAGLIMGANMFYSGGTNDFVAVLIYSLPFVVPGVLFYLVGEKKITN